MNEIRNCYTCDTEVIHETSSVKGRAGNQSLLEAEYCWNCDEVFCPNCMDFTTDDNICKECEGGLKHERINKNE